MQTNQSYWDFYTHDIMPRLKNIDLLLKTSTVIEPAAVAAALDISLSEVYLILSRFHIANITPKSFPIIMQNGSSKICRLFAREIKIGCCDSYAPTQLSYIYNLDKSAIEKAFASLGIARATGPLLREVFKQIPV